jgi:hypothetical protein
MRYFFLLMSLVAVSGVKAQKVETMEFNLYTDSLKKGFYNYISIDGKFTNGQWLPLDSNQVIFTANTGHFKGNDLFIDSSYKGEKVTVRATLRANPALYREATIYIRKRGFDEPLKTNEEYLDELMKRPPAKKKSRSA